MVHVAPPIEWIGFGVTLGYLGTVASMMLYIERQHPTTWDLIGQPSMLFRSSTPLRIGNWIPIIAIFLGLGFLFRNVWKLPDDPMLTLTLWIARILFVTALSILLLADKG
ncbi:MAG TPA: hypothetical protein PLN53_00355 [Terricaulis sp.]|nr:hypothetical protein [Terricaulis sp.]